jgi:hypothetical protein
MSTRHATWILLLASLLLVSPAKAQEGDPDFTPSNNELDQDLDDSLRDEYTDEEEVTPPVPPVVADVDHEDTDRLRLRFGGIASYAWSSLTNVEMSHREGRSGGQTVDLHPGDDGADSSFDLENGAGNYRMWLGLGRYVSLQGAWFHGRFRDAAVLGRQPGSTPGFTFGRTQFVNGDVVDVSHELQIADYDIVVHPLNLNWIRLDLSLGVRYVYWRTKVERHSRRYSKEDERLEGLIPMVGVGLTLSPVSPLAFFVRARVGTVEYERESSYHRERGRDHRGRRRVHHVDAKERSHTSAEIDAGFTITIDNTIGLIFGAKIQYIELERIVPSRSMRLEGYANSLYVGLFLNF